ncbi:ABC transporter ATP-binding protein [Fibrobacter succinogenes]|uniref:ABC transporter ATP-binding protein n=1 Tax=Fibrobacter succinogenes TaxID=833 RepID=UPI00156A1830|nr:ABC transporter ATP-binding protein [Fibrobacter succinogenes]
MLKTLKRIIKLSGKYKGRVYWGLVCSILNSVFNCCSVLAILWVLMNINNLTMNIIWETVAILAAGLIGKTTLKFLTNIFMTAAGYIIFTDKRLELGDKLKNAPMGYFSKKTLGRINNTITTNMATLENYTMMAVDNVVGGILQGICVSIFLMIFEWEIGIIAILGIILSTFSLSAIQKKSGSLSLARYNAVENVTNDVIEYIRGIAVIRSFGRGNASKLDETFDEFEKTAIKMEKGILVPHGFFRATLEIFSGIIILTSAWLTYQGTIEFSYGMMFLVSGFIIYGQMELLANGAFMMEQIETSMDQMDETYSVPKLTGTQAVDKSNTDIEIKNVTFGYDSRIILDKVSAKIPAKSKCAIVGYSGSGKTTLCNLIVRFWDVQSGSITFGGKDIRSYTPDELLSHFSMVFQNVFLFNDTVENNIKFGCPNATHEQIVEVAKRARCHEFIEALPNGYDTIIGENGSSLSGGEKQRISIARALLKDAPVVILDEATSSVDPENECELMEAIAELTKGKTVISIAHRLNTVKNADQILVIDHGNIVQRGTHQELCNVDGVYKKFLDIRQSSAGWSIT